jgi:hypothetical protein
MAKSDSDSNGLRQDQPECTPQSGVGWREHQIWCYRRDGFGTPLDRPGVTELPGLTSDPICTADRRGGILISSGPDCMPEGHLSPSSRQRRDDTRVVRGPSAVDEPSSHLQCNALLHIRASNWNAPKPTGVASTPRSAGESFSLKRPRVTCRSSPDWLLRPCQRIRRYKPIGAEAPCGRIAWQGSGRSSPASRSRSGRVEPRTGVYGTR